MYHPGMKSSLRLTVEVSNGAKTLYFYDKGLKMAEDPQNKLSSHVEFARIEPRFLEDIIADYGRENIKIREWGKYADATIVYVKGGKKVTTQIKDLVTRLML